jgi:hypothetical protein
MTRNECLLNIIAGTNHNDAEDIVIRRALFCAVRERYFDDLVPCSIGRRSRLHGGLGGRCSPASYRKRREVVSFHRTKEVSP